MSQTLSQPIGDRHGIDSFRSAQIEEIALVADTPLAFPPADLFPGGGRFLIFVPAGSSVSRSISDDGARFPMPPGIHDLSVRKSGDLHFHAAADVTIVVDRQRVIGE